MHPTKSYYSSYGRRRNLKITLTFKLIDLNTLLLKQWESQQFTIQNIIITLLFALGMISKILQTLQLIWKTVRQWNYFQFRSYFTLLYPSYSVFKKKTTTVYFEVLCWTYVQKIKYLPWEAFYSIHWARAHQKPAFSTAVVA